MRFSYSILILMVTCIVVAACSSNETTTVATSTSTLSFTPPSTKTPSTTPTFSPTPDYVATQNFIETDSVNAVVSTVQPVTLAEYSSPNGKWRVDVIRYDCIKYSNGDYIGIIAYEQLKLVDLNNGTTKVIDEQRQNCDGIGTYGLGGLYWSPNNRYFYYTDSREGYPETCGNYVVPTIYRLDTISKETILVGGGHISPDQTKLAMWQENEIVIWDLDKGEVGRGSGLIPNMLNGQISWSPDSQSIAYLQTTFDCAPDYGKVYATRLNLPDLSQSLLFEHEAPGFGWLNWDTSTRITLRDGMGKIWIYGLVSNDLKPDP